MSYRCALCGVGVDKEGVTVVYGSPLCPSCTTNMWGKPVEAFVGISDSGFKDNPGFLPAQRVDGRPPQFSVPHEQVVELFLTNGVVKDVLGVVADSRGVPKPLRAVAESLIEEMNGFNEFLVGHQKFGEAARRSAPILLDKGYTDFVYKVFDMAESLYGRFLKEWFLTKRRDEWRAWRLRLYISVWHVGSIRRYGVLAKGHSPWITGEKKEMMDGDPFGNQPIGKEENPVF